MLTIYLDQVFVRYLMLELLSFLFLQIWFHIRLPVWKCVSLPFFLAVIQTGCLVLTGFGPLLLPSELLVQIFFIRIAVGKGQKKRTFAACLAKLFFSLGMAGLFLWLQSIKPEMPWFIQGSVLGMAALVCLALLERRHRLIDQKSRSVVLHYDNHTVKLVALYDTGNLLRDPYVNRPVHIIDRETAESLGLSDGLARQIPYSSIGRKDGLMQVFTIDEMDVDAQKINRPVIGIAPFEFLHQDGVHMILAADLS